MSKYSKHGFVLALLTFVFMTSAVSAESWGFDSAYQQGLSSSSRDSSMYVPMNPRSVSGQPVTGEDATVPESMREERTEYDWIQSNSADIGGLSLNGARMVESLYFKNGAMELNESFLDNFGSNYQSVMMPSVVKGFDGSYIQIQIVDLNSGVNISNLFRSDDGGRLDILELNPGGHGYEIVYARENANSGWKFYILPITSEPGQLELLINDNLVVVFKPLGIKSVTPTKMSTDVEVLFSSMDNGRIIDEPDWMDDIFIGSENENGYDSNDPTQSSDSNNNNRDTDNGWNDIWSEVPDELTNQGNYVDPTGKTPAQDNQFTSNSGTSVDYKVPNNVTLKKGGEERYTELMKDGIDSATALSIVIEEGYLVTNAAEADKIRRDQQQNDSLDDFFQDMGINNINTGGYTSSTASSQNSSTSYYDSWMQQSISNTTKTNTKRKVDTSGIDLNPMIWGIASKDGGTYGEVTLDGNSLIKEWTDTYTVDITSLSGKAHEYVLKKAVRPTKIIAIEPTKIKREEKSFLIPVVLVLGAVGLVVIYLMIVNTYVARVRKRIKMAEIEGMKSSGTSGIGDLDSFEITA